ncbi:tetratricopeptide (TPR) repeat protein [Chitinophaga terrae (ex Kim and Jung 2007)]|uniref:DUF2911 domain-containing protein n=1 Tax=Chitinophaga terrae (ex Kim and Jung 2007) TaxID=408074 RepID=UPI002780F8D5|nr:DUF2911 domain-containing protein [Chitinophaga terrae (ex Kim and Jung 2007)]MDQ0106391.1 tetratricopeptide (TPR) repeat protein [Chitinophaga terrae (ex Kim and Jung 2007)]
MRTFKTFAAVAGAMLLLHAGSALAQGIKMPAPSPKQTVKQDFALSSIELNYSRPQKNGRVIMGDLVPYDKVWRTGANGATTITFGEDISFGGTPVKAGTYGLLTIPGAKQWTVILTKSLDVTSPAAYKPENDVARVQVKPVALPFSQESFFIGFDNVKSNSVELDIIWDKTKVPVNITADIDATITSQIESAMQSDKKPYFQAAVYYFENNKDLNKAVEWINEAANQTPDAFWVWYQKARINAKAKNTSVAKEAAQKSIELATAAKNDDYVTLNKKLLATLK